MKYIIALILAVSFIGWRIFSLIPGQNDPYYLKFTNGKFSALVIGSSRTAQGIIPSKIDRGIYNYSFNSIIGPYGPAYSEAIRKKISPDARGPFIIEINPSLLANSPVRERSDVFTFSEDGGLLARMRIQSLSPNPEYVIRSRKGPFYKNLKMDPVKLHSDGWLEIPLIEHHELMKKNGWMVKSYENLFKTHVISRKRTEVLRKIIKTLKARGEVFLIRMPTSPEVAAVEDHYFPKFGEFSEELSRELGVKFLDFYKIPGMTTKDGDHLNRESAETITGLIKVAVLRKTKL